MILFLLSCSFILLIFYSALLIYYKVSWAKIPDFTPVEKTASTFISVIIPARNEAANIRNCLESISRQLYPTAFFEVLVVDDHSTDETAAIVRSFGGNVRLIRLQDHISNNSLNSYKKKAIEIAVELSTGKLIVTTDADCVFDSNWLLSMALFYEEYRPAFIAAPVSINCSLNFVQIFQALDFMTLQGITGASVYKNIHSMCNGANLAYEKVAYMEVNGFEGIDKIASGDDMMLMHKIYKRYPQRVMFLKSPEAIVHTAPVNGIRAFFNQRIRWASKADSYDDKRIIVVLVIVYLFNVCLLTIPIVAALDNYPFLISGYQFSLLFIWLSLLVLKTVVELFFLYPVAGFFNKRPLLWAFPLMQPFHIVYTVIAGWLGKFGTYKWKERQVK